MPITDIEGDLFSNDKNNVALAHCVSSDLVMGKGIALEFRKRFSHLHHSLKDQSIDAGNTSYLCTDIGNTLYLCTENGRYIFYLITKLKYYNKPTYDTLRISLQSAKQLFVKFGIKDIAIPEIGCGLDRLDWNKVKEIIQEEWNDLNVFVYHYNKKL